MRRASCRAMASPRPAPCVTPFAAAAIVQVEQLLGGLGREAASLVADLEAPVAGAHRGASCTLPPPYLCALSSRFSRITRNPSRSASTCTGSIRPSCTSPSLEVRARCASRSAMKRAASMRCVARARIARHGALVGEDRFRQMLEPVAFELAELDQLGALRIGNAADRETLQQPLDSRHRRLELVAGELQQLLHVFALLLAPLREHEQHHQAARQQQREQRRFAHQHHFASLVMLRAIAPSRSATSGAVRCVSVASSARSSTSLLRISPRNRMVHQTTSDAVSEQRHGEHDELGAFREPLAEAWTHQSLSFVSQHVEQFIDIGGAVSRGQETHLISRRRQVDAARQPATVAPVVFARSAPAEIDDCRHRQRRARRRNTARRWARRAAAAPAP